MAFIMAYIGLWFIGLFYLLSCANINQPTNGSQFKSINLNNKDELKWMIAVYVLGLFWISELLAAIFMYMQIVGVCTWYFSSTYKKRGNFSLFKGLWWSFRYNFGSLAFGSFLLAVVWCVRAIFEYIDKKSKNMLNNNAAVNCFSNCIRCCLACLHRFIKFLNKNAYI